MMNRKKVVFAGLIGLVLLIIIGYIFLLQNNQSKKDIVLAQQTENQPQKEKTDKIKEAYEKALKAGTIEAYAQFIVDYHDSDYAEEISQLFINGIRAFPTKDLKLKLRHNQTQMEKILGKPDEAKSKKGKSKIPYVITYKYYSNDYTPLSIALLTDKIGVFYIETGDMRINSIWFLAKVYLEHPFHKRWKIGGIAIGDEIKEVEDKITEITKFPTAYYDIKQPTNDVWMTRFTNPDSKGKKYICHIVGNQPIGWLPPSIPPWYKPEV